MKQVEESLFSRSYVLRIFGLLWKLRWEKHMVDIVLKIAWGDRRHDFDGAVESHST